MRKFGMWVLALLLTLCVGVEASAQRRVTGRVVGPSGEPIQSATVNVQGTTIGAYTAEDGRFTLVNVPAGAQTVQVRRIGFRRQVVPLGVSATELSVSLERDVLQLEAQVVTGTNTTVASVNAANAVSVVSSEELTRVSAPTIDQALTGKIAGALTSQNSGAPGGGGQVQLRGISTINGAYSPLYVVDGVIVNNSTINNGQNVISGSARGNYSSSQDQSVNRIADLNPNDIESVQVLKGPSASSMYGSKGTNGVIIITTKQGNAGRTSVDFVQRVGRSVLANSLGARCFGSAAEYGSWARTVAGVDSAASAAEFTAAPVKCQDFEKQFYNNDNLAYESVLSLRGGLATGTTYFLSGLVKHDNGLAQNDFYNKQSLRLNLGQAIGSRLTIGANSELLHTLTQRGLSGNDNNGTSPISVFSATPSFYELRRRDDGTFPINGSPLLNGTNPFQNSDIIKTPNNTYRFISSLRANLGLLASDRQTLDASLTGGVDTYSSKDRIVSPATGYTESASFGALAGTLFNSDANFLNANVNGSLVHRFVMPVFTAQTSAGFRQERRESNITQITGRGVIFPTVTNVASASQTFPDQTIGLSKDFALFAQEEFFALEERLLLTAGINAEKTSNNGNQDKYYMYPKFSASYRLPLLPAQVSELKLRLAYGKAGNQPTAGRFTFLTPLLYEGLAGTRASTVKGAAEIQPELATETEGGLDVTAFDSRVRFSATTYKKQITDLLLTAPIVPSTGFTTQYLNGGQITNRGTELELDVTAFTRGTTSWISSVNFTRQRGVVDDLPEGIAPFNPGVGSFGSRYGNAWIQEGQSTSVIQATIGCAVALPASGNCPAASRIVGFAGDANPDFNMGFNNLVNVGPVRLSGLVEWRKGGDAVNLTNNYYDSYQTAADTAASNARYSIYRAGGAAYVEDAGFVKLREITVGYQVPSALTNSLFGGRARDVRLELSGRNLKTWTKYTGLDPEVSNFGNQALGRFQDVTPYPPARQIFFSLNTSF